MNKRLELGKFSILLDDCHLVLLVLSPQTVDHLIAQFDL